MKHGFFLIPLVLAIAPAGAQGASVTAPGDPGLEALLEAETDIFSPIPKDPGTAATGIFTVPTDRQGLGERPGLTDPMRPVRPKSQWARPAGGEKRAQSFD